MAGRTRAKRIASGCCSGASLTCSTWEQMPAMRELPDLDDMMPADPFGEEPEIENPLAGVDQTQSTEQVSKDELEALQVAFEKRRDSKAKQSPTG